MFNSLFDFIDPDVIQRFPFAIFSLCTYVPENMFLSMKILTIDCSTEYLIFPITFTT